MMRGVMGNDGGGNWRRRGDAATQAPPQPQAPPQAGDGRNWGTRGSNGGDGSGWTGRNRPDGQARSGGGWRRGDNRGGVTPQPAPGQTSDRNGNGRVDRNWDHNRDGRVDQRWDRNRDGSLDRRWDRNGNGSVDQRWDRNRDGRFDRGRGDNRHGWGGNDRRRWDRSWRNQRDYDWRGYRNQYRNHYRAPSYYSPYGYSYGYRRFSIGIYLESLFYSDRYWINDPWQYRLPDAYGPYRWVRYYNDVLLVDLRSGEVVDVINDFFW